MAAAPPIAFSLLEPLQYGWRQIRQMPVAIALGLGLLLLPLLILALGFAFLNDEGLFTAFQQLVAGAPKNAPGALIVEPGWSGIRLFAAALAILVLAVAVILTAIFSVALAVQYDSRSGRDVIATALALWPSLLGAITVQVTVVAVILSAIVAVGVVSASVQFHLPSFLITVGSVFVLVQVIRLSLWLPIALEEDRGAISSITEAWKRTKGHATRVVGAAFAIFVAFGVPGFVLSRATSWLLWRLEQTEVLALSPTTIQFTSLLVLLVFLPPALLVWSIGLRFLVKSIERVSPASAA